MRRPPKNVLAATLTLAMLALVWQIKNLSVSWAHAGWQNVDIVARDVFPVSPPSVVPLFTSTKQEDIIDIAKPYYNAVSLDGFKPNRTFFSLRLAQISTIPQTYFIPGGDICKDANSSIAEAVFLVPSVATEEATRERFMIRTTWARSLYTQKWRQIFTVRLAFFFGSQNLSNTDISALQVESSKFRDLVVIEDLIDNYENLSLKVAAMLTWAAHKCPQVKAAIKVDMDTYVKVGGLMELMNQLPSRFHPNFIFGHQHDDVHPLVLRKGRWKVSNETYPFRTFPRYVFGPSYAVSGPAVKQLAQGFPYFPVVPNEDAYVTGLMAQTLNISLFHHDSFADKHTDKPACVIVSNRAVSVLLKEESVSDFWKKIHNETLINYLCKS